MLLSTVTWTGLGTNDFWSNADNWDTVVPVAGDDVVIPATSESAEVRFDGTAVAVNSLDSDEPFRVTASTLTLSGAGPFSFDDGLTISSGTINGTADFTINNGLAWSFGTFGGTGTITVNGVSTLTGSTKTLSGKTIDLNGDTTWSAGTINLSNDAVINLNSGATLQVTGSSLVMDDTDGDGIDEQFNLFGHLLRSAGTSELRFDVEFNVDGSGTGLDDGIVDVNTGTLRLRGEASFIDTTIQGAGTLQFELVSGTSQVVDFNSGSSVTLANARFVGSGDTINFNSGSTYDLSGSSTVVSAGTVNFNAGAIVGNLGDVTLSNGILNLSTGAAISFSSYTQTNGTLTGSDDITVLDDGDGLDTTRTMSWSFGTITGTGLFRVEGGLRAWSSTKTLNIDSVTLSGGTLNLSSGAAHSLSSYIHTNGTLTGSDDITVLDDGDGLDTTRTMSWSFGTITGMGVFRVEGGLRAFSSTKTLNGRTMDLASNTRWESGTWTLSNGAVLTNESGQTFEVTGNVTLDDPNNNGIGETFNNFGHILRSAGTSFFTIEVVWNNDGSGSGLNDGVVDIQTGQLRARGDSAFISTAFQGAGSLDWLAFSGGEFDFDAATTIVNPIVDFSAGAARFSAAIDLTSSAVQVSGGTLDFAGTATLNTLLMSSGRIQGAGSVTTQGLFDWRFGTVAGTDVFTVAGGLQFTTSGSTQTLDGRQMDLTSDTLWSAGTWRLDNGAVLNHMAGSTFNMAGNVLLDDLGSNNDVNFNNFGTLLRDTTTGIATIDVIFSVNSTVQVDSGTLSLTRRFTNFDPGSNTLSGGTYIVNAIATAGTVTLRWPDAEIFTNDASITLNGPNARITNTVGQNALDQFARNTAGAAFRLDNGATLTTSAAGARTHAFSPGLGTLVSIAHDPATGSLFIYDDFATTIKEFTPAGTIVAPAIALTGTTSNNIDLDFLTEAADIGGTVVPAGSLLVFNGDGANELLQALDKSDGSVLASVVLTDTDGVSALPGQLVGGAYHPGRDTVFLANQITETIQEINPVTGAIIATFDVDPLGSPLFTINFGDLDVDLSTGNLMIVSSDQSRIREMTPDGVFVRDIEVAQLGITSMSGIALNNASGEIWITTTSGKVFGLTAPDFEQAFVNSGNMTLVGSSFTVAANSQYTQRGGRTALDDGTLTASYVEILAGTLGGNGTINGQTFNASTTTVAPGLAGPGLINFNGSFANQARPEPLFLDTFDGENDSRGQLGYSAFDNWTVTSGTVDLFGPGSSDPSPGHGLYVDMAGTNAGRIETAGITLDPGAYLLTFDLGSNGASNLLRVQISDAAAGDVFSEDFSPTSGQKLTRLTRTIVVSTETTVTISFEELGGADSAGSLIDDVALTPLAGPGAAGGINVEISNVPTPIAPGQVLLGPTPYLQFSDSPFDGLTFDDYFYLEDFEDGLFNTPGVTASAGAPRAPGSATDSVDGDDGVIDGSGTAGRSFLSTLGSAGITFTFDESALGALPTHAGIVWTDGAGTIAFAAFDRNGDLLGIRSGSHAGSGGNQTAEDRFYGVTHDDGIASIRISNSTGGIEIDHLQYGRDSTFNNNPPTQTFDQLDVTGGVALGGAVNLSLIDGFVPSVGDTFAIIPNATALFGEFATVTGSQINNDGLFFDVEYRANGVDAIVAQLDAGPDQSIAGGVSLSLAATFGDPQANDDFTASIDWGDGSNVEAGVVDQVANTVSGTHIFPGSGTYFPTVTIVAADGTKAVDSFQVTVLNAAPEVDADNASVTVDEGATATNTGTVSDLDGDAVTLAASAGTVTDNADGTWSWSLGTTDGPDDLQTITITATDIHNASSTTTFSLTVNNVAPSVAADNASVTVNEGTTATNTGTYSDPGADTVALSASTGLVTDNADGTWSWTRSTTDGPDDSLTVTITATDSDGAFSTTSFSLTVDNVAPSVAAGTASVTVNEGDTATNTGTHSDPGVDTVTLNASVGSVTDNADGTWSWSFATADGPDDSQTVTITATDSDGAFSTTSFSLTVDNVAPSVAADNASVTVTEGDTATNTGTHSDPGIDTVTLSASVGSVTDNADGTWSWSFATADGPDDSQTIDITATDSDGASTTTSFGLTVLNLAPTVEVDNLSVSANEGATATNTGRHSDPGVDTVTLSASAGTVVDNGDGTWSWSFATTDGPDDSQTIDITATDSDGASTTTSFGLTVNNVAPSVAAGPDQAVNDGDTVSISATFSDPGLDTHTAQIDWGDSTVDTIDPETSPVTGSHVYAAGGTYTVTVTVTDDDGLSGSDTLLINVSAAGNDAPQINDDNALVTVDEGATASNTGTVSDPDGDPVTLTASAGVVTDNADGTWSWSLATSDGPDDSQTVTITATDSNSASSSTTFNLTVNNVDPVITDLNVSATSINLALPGDTVTLDGTFSDDGLPDTHNLVIDWGDGTQTIINEGDTAIDQLNDLFAIDHIYATGGIFEITVTLFDDDGGSTSTTTTALVTGARLTEDGVLQVVGTNGPDMVQVQKRGSTQIRLVSDFVVPRRQSFDLADVTLIHIMLFDGNDTAALGRVAISAIIEGGAGADDIRGGRGPDLLIGGTGAVFIKGRPGGDILIAGTTSYDGNAAALYAIMAEWTNTAEPYASRVDHILNGGGLNGGFTLNVANVFDDGDPDELKPGTGLDLLFYDVDGNNIVRTSNLLLEEVIVDLDTV